MELLKISGKCDKFGKIPPSIDYKIKSIVHGIVRRRKVKMIGLDTIIGCLVFVLLVHYMIYIWESL